ncbi:MAG: hypothetical protein KDD82_15045, partial [Planctomycetes bacterium]|nr:hypothetical protein [Planctomycetota bacterium]
MLHGHNQGAALAAAASRWCASGSPRAVVAVDDRSEDETEDLLAALVAEGRPGLRVQRSEFVVGPWESVRRALAELPEVGYVHLPALEAEPQPEAIARALAGAEGAGVVFAPRDRRSALGALLERSGAVRGDAPWSFADSEALAERLGQLPPAFELGPSAW